MSAWAGPPAKKTKNESDSKGLGETGPATRWLMAVKRGTFLKRGELRIAQADCRHQIVQPHVVAEVQPTRRRPGNALHVDALEPPIGEQLLHPFGTDELVEIVRSLRDPPEPFADGDHQQLR